MVCCFNHLSWRVTSKRDRNKETMQIKKRDDDDDKNEQKERKMNRACSTHILNKNRERDLRDARERKLQTKSTASDSERVHLRAARL